MQTVPGVSEVASYGGFQKQYQVSIDPYKLVYYNIPFMDVAKAITSNNRDVGGSLYEMNSAGYMIRGLGYIKNLEDIRDIAVGSYKSIPIKLKDIADVQMSGDLRLGIIDENGNGEAVGGIVVMRYGENAKDVIDRIKEKITEEKIISRIKLINKTLVRDFGITKPRIAVLGLNPHSGDGGLLGDEEQKIISPAVKKIFAEGIYCFGAYSADGFFGAGTFRQFDAVLAMYHDQGLIPFKTISFEDGVNFTAGLPIVRTSPDHGTAYDIAGKNKASESSLRAAVYLACDIFAKRNENKELSANPLKSTRKELERG